MSNELIFIALGLLGLILALGAYKLGKVWMIGYIITLLIFANTIVPHGVEVFGLATVPGTVLFGAIYLSTDMLAERYGPKVAHLSVLLAAVATCLFLGLIHLSLQLQPLVTNAPGTLALHQVFDASPRVFASSMLAYIIWQNVDVWLYGKIHQYTGEKYLWLRNNVSTIFSNIMAVITFWFLAFNGVMPWWELATVGMVVLAVTALLDTPFIYWAKRITPLDVRR